MKYELDEKVTYKGQEVAVYDFSPRHHLYTIKTEGGKLIYEIQEEDIKTLEYPSYVQNAERFVGRLVSAKRFRNGYSGTRDLGEEVLRIYNAGLLSNYSFYEIIRSTLNAAEEAGKIQKDA